MSDFDIPLSIALGVGLAAATGFRVFLPMIIVSGAAYIGHLPLSDGFAWLGTGPALTMLSVAALAEILAYYVPGVDNLLDTHPRTAGRPRTLTVRALARAAGVGKATLSSWRRAGAIRPWTPSTRWPHRSASVWRR